MTRLVLFDVDGTLIQTRGAGVRAFERTAATQFQVVDGTRNVQFAGRTDASLVREIFANHGVTPSLENFARFFECYVFWLDHLLNTTQGGPCPGVWPFLNALRALPQPPLLGLLTGNIRLGAEIKLRRFGLWELFAVGAFGDDHEDRNQLAALARRRASRVLGRQLAGREVLVVGDTRHDIDCGRAIGGRTLAVATGGATLDELRGAQPDWLVADLLGVNAAEVCGGGES